MEVLANIVGVLVLFPAGGGLMVYLLGWSWRWNVRLKERGFPKLVRFGLSAFFLLASFIIIPIALTALCSVLTGPPHYRLGPDEAPGPMGDGDLSLFLLLLWPLGVLMLIGHAIHVAASPAPYSD